jgi:hypothetical protein
MVFQEDNIKAIYPDVLGSQRWFVNQDSINNDPRLQIESNSPIEGDSLYGFYTLDRNPRLTVVPSSGFTDGDVSSSVDHSLCAAQGYMLSPTTDWGDVEQTSYFKFVTVDSPDASVFMAQRGANPHTQGLSDHGCQGCNYFVEMGKDGRVRFGKEQWHVSVAYKPWQDGLKQTALSKGWFGMKFIVSNVDIGQVSKLGVRLELWLDKNNDNNWIKITSTIDSGGWGTLDDCGEFTPRDQILSFSAPCIIFGLNSQQEIRFKNMSVRTVAPGAQFQYIPNAVSGNRIYASLRMHYRIGTMAAATCQTETPTDPNPPPPPPPPGKVTITKKIAEKHQILQ